MDCFLIKFFLDLIGLTITTTTITLTTTTILMGFDTIEINLQGDHYYMSQKCWLITFILIKNWLFSSTSPLLQI